MKRDAVAESVTVLKSLDVQWQQMEKVLMARMEPEELRRGAAA
jgi:hypothetical protein